MLTLGLASCKQAAHGQQSSAPPAPACRCATVTQQLQQPAAHASPATATATAARLPCRCCLAGLVPDEVTYSIVLSTASRAGDWDTVQQLLEVMHSQGMPARTPVYAAYLRQLCKLEEWNRALSLFLVMQVCVIAQQLASKLAIATDSLQRTFIAACCWSCRCAGCTAAAADTCDCNGIAAIAVAQFTAAWPW